MDGFERALELLPRGWRQAASRFDETAEEIRLRNGRSPTLLLPEGEHPFFQASVTEETLLQILEKATGASVHTAAPALAEGYLSYRGIRIGVCGASIVRDQKLTGFRHVSSLAIRIPRECRGICKKELEEITSGRFENTLIIGCPGAGKTSVLREWIRRLSEMGFRMGVADERNELAALDGAEPQFDLGPCSDVMIGLSRVDAAAMLIRGMNPQILAMDELTRKADLEAVQQIFGCGVGILATAHGTEISELRKRRAYRVLLDQGVFSRCLLVERTKTGRRYALKSLPT